VLHSRLSKKAFTLLELIVVVVVLGILAALAIPSFSTVKQSAADKIAVQSAESVVRNARSLAAFDGAALSDAYVDQAGSEIGVKYNSSTNTVTVTSSGLTGAATINASTGAITVAAGSVSGFANTFTRTELGANRSAFPGALCAYVNASWVASNTIAFECLNSAGVASMGALSAGTSVKITFGESDVATQSTGEATLTVVSVTTAPSSNWTEVAVTFNEDPSSYGTHVIKVEF
jgi:prepilin-type N-terminal cleavage/methylation domain-containing protein